MTTLKFLTVFLFITLYSCGQKPAKHKADPAAVALNNKAMELVPFIDNPDCSKKALSLLDQATNIDSEYFLGFNNKLMFLYQLKQFDKAALTVNKLIDLRPSAHDLYLMGGVLYERLGDTISSKNHFQKSLTICNSVLDTMNVKNRDYDMLFMNKAINVIMLGDEAKGNELLKQLYDKQTDDTFKELTASFMNKSKKELVDFMTENKYSH
jgi:tetratricopeptide (TPR) repeat protein